jgi:hypothetical protein
MKYKYLLLISLGAMLTSFSGSQTLSELTEPEGFIQFNFQGKKVDLHERIRVLPEDCWGGFCQTNEELDTLCNVFLPKQGRVKIIRQDDGYDPMMGLGLLFQFNPAIDSLPFESPSAKLQIVDFHFGGMRSTASDRTNYTGVTNDVSSDLKLIIEHFEDDIITGTFSGVLVNGAGGMASIDGGKFRVRVFAGKN